MTIIIPLEPLAILHTLQQAGFEAYIVGGAVRDLIRTSQLGSLQNVTDFDFTTNATPEELQKLFPEHFYENIFGTVSITPKHLREQLQLPAPLDETEATPIKPSPRLIDLAQATKIHESLQKPEEEDLPMTPTEVIPYEITTFRSDGVYTDHRRPESVTWGTTLQEDLDRRDFTINAMAIQISEEMLEVLFANTEILSNYPVTFEPDQYTLIDPHQGASDLENHLVRTVGEPTTRFEEDALRMLRAIRFAVQLNMRIDEPTYQAIHDRSTLLQHISAERIRDEFVKMLLSEYPKEAIELLDESNLLQHILPELLLAKGVQQGGHHITDVWTHSLDALAHSPSKDPVVRLATLLHDIGKPETYDDRTGQPTFYNHEVIGAKIAKKIAVRLRFSSKDAERIFTLVRHHMFHYQAFHTDAAIRRFMRKVGLENIDDILDLREADRLGSGARKTSWRLEEMKERMIEQLNQPLAVTDLAIDGTDLITELQLEPGPVIGKLLHTLFEQVLEDPSLNAKETLLAKARQELAESAQQ